MWILASDYEMHVVLKYRRKNHLILWNDYSGILVSRRSCGALYTLYLGKHYLIYMALDRNGRILPSFSSHNTALSAYVFIHWSERDNKALHYWSNGCIKPSFESNKEHPNNCFRSPETKFPAQWMESRNKIKICRFGRYQGHLLSIWLNFNPIIRKYLHPL